MRISRTKQFVLLHVPRTGVGSVIAALDEDLFVKAEVGALGKLGSKYLPVLPRRLERTYFRTHETAAQVRRLLPADLFERFRKIAFVRNPYSWLVSFYEVLRASPRHGHYRDVERMAGFAEYVDWEIARGKRLQHPYLTDRSGRALVDVIGRYERLAEDTQRIFGSLGVATKPLPHLGRYTPRDYRDYYDTPTKRKVAARWARDLELLSYDFDGIVD